MRFLPLGLSILCSLIVAPGVESQKCRLIRANQQPLIAPSIPPTLPPSVGPHTTIPTPETPSTATPTPAATVSPSPSATFQYGVDKIRGVNLGGWLVLEPWISPSIFEQTGNDAIIDEYTFGQLQDQNLARSVLERHWETWIAEDDFRDIKAAGLTHVRIPLGYWSVPLESQDTTTSTSVDPYIPGAWPYLMRGLNWAKQYGLQAIVDIHGAPGSQNGYDNSGQRTTNVQWAGDESNVRRTVDTVRYVARTLGGMIDILELLNEPAGFISPEFVAVVRQYWLDGYSAVREAAGEGIKVMIGDAFAGVQHWNGFLTYPNAQGVLMDVHMYQVFSNLELSRNWDEHINFTCTHKAEWVEYSSSQIWTVIGEWSNAFTDCAKWLNGRGVGIRWEGTRAQPDAFRFGSCEGLTGDYRTFSPEYLAFLRKYFEVQIELGESMQGWVFWTWKAENADEWSYQRGLEGGWIPRDPTERKHPNLCP